MKYNAFISYSHAADGRMAPALQSALERFAKPWYKLRNLNIFRDEASLSASPHLWTNIQKALDDSEYLIYMASPESAASKWVNKEIKYWLEIRSLDTLLIVLSDGLLNWEDDNNKMSRQDDNSLPPILDHAIKEHPFYVDLRDMRSESDLSLKNPIFKKDVLKLSAQLHGKAPKDLASEEVNTHRKMIWTRNIAAFLLVSLLIFSFLSTKSALQSSKTNRLKDIAIAKGQRANINIENELEKQKLEKKIVDDSLKNTQEQKRLSDKLAATQSKLAEQAAQSAKRALISSHVSRNQQSMANLAIMNSEAKWHLLDSLKLRGININDGFRIIKKFEAKDHNMQSTIFYDTKNIGIEKHKDLPLYKIKLLNRKNEVISQIDSVSLELKKN